MTSIFKYKENEPIFQYDFLLWCLEDMWPSFSNKKVELFYSLFLYGCCCVYIAELRNEFELWQNGYKIMRVKS